MDVCKKSQNDLWDSLRPLFERADLGAAPNHITAPEPLSSPCVTRVFGLRQNTREKNIKALSRHLFLKSLRISFLVWIHGHFTYYHTNLIVHKILLRPEKDKQTGSFL